MWTLNVLLVQTGSLLTDPWTTARVAARRFAARTTYVGVRSWTDGVDAVMRQHRESHSGELYFRKSADWQTEFEHRYVLLNDGAPGDKFVDVSSSLKGVVFGDQFPPDAIATVKATLGEEIQYARVVLPGRLREPRPDMTEWHSSDRRSTRSPRSGRCLVGTSDSDPHTCREDGWRVALHCGRHEHPLFDTPFDGSVGIREAARARCDPAGW